MENERFTELDKRLADKLGNGREYRRTEEITVRAAQEGEKEMIVEGYATTFNEPYLLFEDDGYKVYEQVDARAFDECDMSDVIMQYDHVGRVFARLSNGTLQLQPDEHGLKITADLGGTEIGRQLYEEIKGGYTNKMSFGFTVCSDEKKYTEDKENHTVTVIRTINGLRKLYDVSAVSLPANDATEISSRSFSEGIVEELRKELAERERKRKKLRILMEVSK